MDDVEGSTVSREVDHTGLGGCGGHGGGGVNCSSDAAANGNAADHTTGGLDGNGHGNVDGGTAEDDGDHATDDSDTPVIFVPGDMVIVERRKQPGMNEEGGVGTVTAVHAADAGAGAVAGEGAVSPPHSFSYDIAYFIGSHKEQGVAAKFVCAYNPDAVLDEVSVGESHTRRRASKMLGRCCRPDCGSFIRDCGHDQSLVLVADTAPARRRTRWP